MKGLSKMKLLQTDKIIKALKDYEITEETQPVNVSFSKEFEDKMDKFILQKKRRGKIILITQRAAVAVIALALAGSWLYLMLLPRYQDEMIPGSEVEGQDPHPVEVKNPEELDNIIIGPKNPEQPTGQLIIRNEEPQMGVDSGLRRGITSWEEAHKEATFDLTYPTVLPDRTYLHFIELFQTGEDGSYPCAGALLHKPMIPDTIEPKGVAFLYFFQYYLGSQGNVELSDYNEISRPLGPGFPGESWKYQMVTTPSDIIIIDDIEVKKYFFFHTNIELYNNDIKTDNYFENDSKFLVLHWIQNDVLFRIVAPIFEIDYDTVSFAINDLLPMAESLIKG